MGLFNLYKLNLLRNKLNNYCHIEYFWVFGSTFGYITSSVVQTVFELVYFLCVNICECVCMYV